MTIQRMDNVAIVVDDLDAAVAFFTELGMELEGKGQRSGAGKAVLPFAQDGAGDTDAFETRGKVAVQVTDFNGNSGCDLVLHDATDGRQLDFGTVPKGGSRLLLDPNGRTQVYLSNLYCGIRVSSA
jgi:catechol 2,3-dioxygenase-like lactoylglutathione lyase family enzyme